MKSISFAVAVLTLSYQLHADPICGKPTKWERSDGTVFSNTMLKVTFKDGSVLDNVSRGAIELITQGMVVPMYLCFELDPLGAYSVTSADMTK